MLLGCGFGIGWIMCDVFSIFHYNLRLGSYVGIWKPWFFNHDFQDVIPSTGRETEASRSLIVLRSLVTYLCQKIIFHTIPSSKRIYKLMMCYVSYVMEWQF